MPRQADTAKTTMQNEKRVRKTLDDDEQKKKKNVMNISEGTSLIMIMNNMTL